MKSLKKYKNPLPLNVTIELKGLLSKHVTTKIDLPKINKIRNAFVTFDGLVLNNGLLSTGCSINLYGTKDNVFYFNYWIDTLEKYFVSKYGKSIPSIKLNDDFTYVVIHSKWFNYAFWINAYLPRLIQIKNEIGFKNLKLLVPENWQNIPYVYESLKEFKIQHQVIPLDHQVFVSKLMMPETRKWTNSFQTEIINMTRNELIDIMLKKSIACNNPKKIYLSRKKTGNRGIENEEEITHILNNFNYSIVSFEELSIWEQISMMYSATHFISIHGAGLSNLMFMQPNSKVLELINRPYAKLEYKFPFWKLANTVDLKYFMQLCDTVNDDNLTLSFGKGKVKSQNDYLVNSNLIVDVVKFEENLRLME